MHEGDKLSYNSQTIESFFNPQAQIGNLSKCKAALLKGRLNGINHRRIYDKVKNGWQPTNLGFTPQELKLLTFSNDIHEGTQDLAQNLWTVLDSIPTITGWTYTLIRQEKECSLLQWMRYSYWYEPHKFMRKMVVALTCNWLIILHYSCNSYTKKSMCRAPGVCFRSIFLKDYKPNEMLLLSSQVCSIH